MRGLQPALRTVHTPQTFTVFIRYLLAGASGVRRDVSVAIRQCGLRCHAVITRLTHAVRWSRLLYINKLFCLREFVDQMQLKWNRNICFCRLATEYADSLWPRRASWKEKWISTTLGYPRWRQQFKSSIMVEERNVTNMKLTSQQKSWIDLVYFQGLYRTPSCRTRKLLRNFAIKHWLRAEKGCGKRPQSMTYRQTVLFRTGRNVNSLPSSFWRHFTIKLSALLWAILVCWPRALSDSGNTYTTVLR